jgi:hypothetical protein
MDTLIAALMSNATVTLLVAGFLAAGISMAVKPHGFSAAHAAEVLLAYFLLFSIAIGYLYNFVVHAFFGEMVAHFIGWAQSPFQLEVAFASLGFSAVGFYAFKNAFGVRVAAILGPSLFLLGAAGGHIYQIATSDNLAPGNAGSILYTDILLPVIGAALLWFKCKASSHANAAVAPRPVHG